MRGSNIVVGLDVGTTKVSTIIAEVDDSDQINVIGIGTSRSRGLRKGVVINIEATTQSIVESVAEAEKMADVIVDYVYVGVAGSHISSFNSRGVVAVGGEAGDITPEDVSRAIEAAKAVPIPQNEQIIHILPRYYTVDDQTGIRDPVGMVGSRLEANVHIVVGAVSAVQNLVKSCHRANLEVGSVVLEPIASAEAVLNEDEKELGVCMVDIGGGTTDVAVFHSGAVVHSAVLPIGGNHITNDIAVGLRTTTRMAEELKIRHGCASVSMVEGDESTVEVVNTGGEGSRRVSVRMLCEIIEPRVMELLELVKAEIERSGCYDILPAGVVFTGGSSQLTGLVRLAEDFLGLPSRMGRPINLKGLKERVSSPVHATGIGLIHYGMANDTGGFGGLRGASLLEVILSKMREWFGEFV